MTKGTIHLDNNMDMERLVTLLTNNGYKVKVEMADGIDWLYREYKISYRRKDDKDE